MGSSNFKRRDLNRFTKVYPFVRRSPNYSYVGDKETVIEITDLTFTNAERVTYTFAAVFNGTPVVTAIPKDENVTVYVTDLSSTSVTIESSNEFNGSVQLHAIYVGDS
jgi:adenine-specific DNA methylase